MFRNNTHTKLQFGFTVVEMVIYGAILSTFILILTTMFSSILETQLGSETNSAIVQDGRYLLSRMSYDVGRTTSISTPTVPGGQSSTLQLVIGGVVHTYAVNAGSLTVTNTSGVITLNSFGTSVSNVSFTRLGNSGGKNSVRMSFTLTSNTERTDGAESRDFVSAFALR